MSSAVSGITSNTSSSSSSSSSTGTKALSSSDFLNLMIQQLSQQDPLNPTDSNQLLTQMSQISNLQANTDMQTSLSSLTLQQSIGAGGNLIGKNIQGLDGNGQSLQGMVTSIKVANKQVYLELDSGKELPMQNVTQIAQASASDLSSLLASNPDLAQLLAAAGGTGGTTNPGTGANAAGATALPAATPAATGASTPVSIPTNPARSKLASAISALSRVH